MQVVVLTGRNQFCQNQGIRGFVLVPQYHQGDELDFVQVCRRFVPGQHALNDKFTLEPTDSTGVLQEQQKAARLRRETGKFRLTQPLETAAGKPTDNTVEFQR